MIFRYKISVDYDEIECRTYIVKIQKSVAKSNTLVYNIVYVAKN